MIIEKQSAISNQQSAISNQQNYCRKQNTLKPLLIAALVGTPLVAPSLQAQPADLSPVIVKQLPMKAKTLDAITIDRNGNR
ncbi:MAG: hypothetical protein ABL925_04555 [Methylococcales bacterium]